MEVIGYGEDALTYWVFSRHMTDLLTQLEDDSPAEKTLFVYRPSFGRAGGHESAQFGEFDAVVGTANAVYLIESKSTGEPLIEGKIRLATRQILRHRIFRWIRQRWVDQCPVHWDAFYNRNSTEFNSAFAGKPLAPCRSRLANNLEYLLRRLSDFPKRTVDVLLYFQRENDPFPSGVLADDSLPEFKFARYFYRPLDNSRFTAMDA